MKAVLVFCRGDMTLYSSNAVWVLSGAVAGSVLRFAGYLRRLAPAALRRRLYRKAA